MFRWSFIKQFPKYALVLAVFVVSTGLFALWWMTRSPGVSNRDREAAAALAAARKAKATRAESRIASLIVIDNDLYDFETGELIFQRWLPHGMPEKLYFEPETKTVLGQYERGLVRYGMDGNEVAALRQNGPLVITDDFKIILFAKEKDVWRASVDWKSLKLKDEKKLTEIRYFNDQFFGKNIILGTEKTIVVRTGQNLLRVDLETGRVNPTRIPLGQIDKRRSPDSKSVIGLERDQFYCYDVDRDDLKTIPVGRGRFNDFHWLDNDRCVAIAAGQTIVLYERLKHDLNEILRLPVECTRLGEPSPDKRYIFGAGRAGLVLIDLQTKTATSVRGGQGVGWISNETFAFSRELPDSQLRGTWIQSVMTSEKRISTEPFLVSPKGSSLLIGQGFAAFATRSGFGRMKSDGSDFAEVIRSAAQPKSAIFITERIPR